MNPNTHNLIFTTSFDSGVVFGNWKVKKTELDSSSKIILPKNKSPNSKLQNSELNSNCHPERSVRIHNIKTIKTNTPRFYFIFFAQKNSNVEWRFQPTKNSELVIINILIDNQFSELNLSQNIIIQKPSCKVTQTTIVIQRKESNVVINQKIEIQKTAINSTVSQYIKTLKLNSKAKTTNNPALKINCPKVIANHGVAIGAFDKKSVLMLQSRGISENQIQKTLLRGFVTNSLPKSLELCWVDIINKELAKVL